MAVYFAFLNAGDTILGMNLSHGGHLTHGSPVSFSGRLYKTAHYGVDPRTGCIDYDAVEDIAKKTKPNMIIAGASAYARTLDFEAFARIARSAGAYLMVDMAHIAGLVAAGVHPSPIPHADVVTSTTHKTLRGPRGGLIVSATPCSDKLNRQVFPGIQGGPLMHVIAAKAVAFKLALTDEFKTYQRNIVNNAKTLSECLMEKGVRLVSNGTDNHMMLVDLTSLNITGKDAEAALGRSGITVNKNSIPFETRSPQVTSGIRIGTPAITSRGMKAAEMTTIADLITTVLKSPADPGVTASVRESVLSLCRQFPIYPEEGGTAGDGS
jgi:glycine hydroxymethyltransferase